MIYPRPESLKQSRSGRVLPQHGLMCPSRASGFVQRPSVVFRLIGGIRASLIKDITI
ncbi:MAG: hypothetical protein JWL66_1688 [Sphingomonadales bacterium]|nr:hypothetical protein [Sphingomonadales bacterium]